MQNATSGGAIMLPTLVPIWNALVASGLSVGGNHSDTALVPAGIAAASVAPNRPRKNARLAHPVANACTMFDSAQPTANTKKPSRVPSASRIVPATDCMTVYAAWNASTTQLYCSVLMENSSLSVGAATDSVERAR